MLKRTIYHRMKKLKQNAQANKSKAMSRFNAGLRWQAENEVQNLLELNAEEARIIKEQNTRRRAEWRAKITAEERTQHQEIIQHTKEHKKSGMHCDFWVQLLASSKSFKNKSILVNYLKWKKYSSFAKLLNRKMKQQTVAVLAGKLCLHRYTILLKSSVFWRPIVFSQGQVLQQHSLRKMLVLMSNCKHSRRRVHVLCSSNTASSWQFIATCWIKNSKLCPDVCLW